MRGLLAVGAYVPYARLDRRSIAEALGVPAGSGTRVVASYDEDTTSMGVEAARAALRGSRVTPDALYFATSDPAYLDKTNATAIHAALDLPASTMAVDMAGAGASAAAGFCFALALRCAFSRAKRRSSCLQRPSSTGLRGFRLGEFQCERSRTALMVGLVVPMSRPIWASDSSG